MDEVDALEEFEDAGVEAVLTDNTAIIEAMHEEPAFDGLIGTLDLEEEEGLAQALRIFKGQELWEEPMAEIEGPVPFRGTPGCSGWRLIWGTGYHPRVDLRR